MRRYLDLYINSLSTGQKRLATDFIYTDRRSINVDLSAIMRGYSSRAGQSFPRVYPLSPVTRSSFMGLLRQGYTEYNSVFNQANSSAEVRNILNVRAENKFYKIEAALKNLETEIDTWEDIFSDTPEASYSIRKSFGEFGLRPILFNESELVLLSTVVESNVPVITNGSVSRASEENEIVEEFFSEENGLQLRLIFNFAPGDCDAIKLEPVSGIGDITMVEMRVYSSQGNLTSTITQDELLDRTLNYSIPRTVVSRIEIDIIDRTYNLIESVQSTTETGEKRTVSPAKTIQVQVGEKKDTTTLVHRLIDDLVMGRRDGLLTPWQRDLLVDMWEPHHSRKSLEDIIHILNNQPQYKKLHDYLMYGPTSGQPKLPYADVYANLASLLSVDTTRVRNVSTPIFETRTIPEQILIEPYTYTTTSKKKLYTYEAGLNKISGSSSFYTEVLRYTEDIVFEHGIPSSIVLSTEEYLPHGSYINFYLIGIGDEIIPLVPKNREWTNEIMRFDQYGSYSLLFDPYGEIYFYKDAGEAVYFPNNGRIVFGDKANFGSLNTILGTCLWTKYQPDHTKCNLIPYASRIASYRSPDGSFGETHTNIPDSKTIELKGTPYVDYQRLDDSTYSPVQIVIDGYSTNDLTNWQKYSEDDFPVEPRYSDQERVINYKVRGKTIFFEEAINRPVKIMYEYVAQSAKLVIELGVINNKSAAPVLYNYTLSYV